MRMGLTPRSIIGGCIDMRRFIVRYRNKANEIVEFDVFATDLVDAEHEAKIRRGKDISRIIMVGRVKK